MKNGALLALVSVGVLAAGAALRPAGSFANRPSPRPAPVKTTDRSGLSVLAFLRRHGSTR